MLSEFLELLGSQKTDEERESESFYQMIDVLEPVRLECTACCGQGRWEAECCNGSGGCTCRGSAVDMGMCLACSGRGFYWSDENVNTMNNALSINTPYLGSGPRY